MVSQMFFGNKEEVDIDDHLLHYFTFVPEGYYATRFPELARGYLTPEMLKDLILPFLEKLDSSGVQKLPKGPQETLLTQSVEAAQVPDWCDGFFEGTDKIYSELYASGFAAIENGISDYAPYVHFYCKKIAKR